jgi:hypothetical protein
MGQEPSFSVTAAASARPDAQDAQRSSPEVTDRYDVQRVFSQHRMLIDMRTKFWIG